jgi:type I restriction enzyme S subunit
MSNIVMPGYKQTEIGAIPNDWSLRPLGQLITSIEYGSSAKSEPAGQTPVLRMGNLQGGQIDWTDLVFTNDEREARKYTLTPGDVLFNRTNTVDLVGKSALYKGDYPAIFAGYLIRVKSERGTLNPIYLNYVLNAEFSRKYSLKVLSVAVGQANINGQKLKTYPIPLPPTKSEQDAIADALDAADAHIESLEQLIAKKRQLKQGAMQELLTGQRRLPGFTEPWETRSIAEVALVDPENLGSETSPNYKFKYISLEDVDRGVLRSYSEQRFRSAPSRARRKLKRSDILVSTVRPNLMSHLLFSGLPDNWICSTGFSVVRCKEAVACPGFVFFHLFADCISRQIEALLTGSNYPAINGKDVRALQIPIPTPSEQAAIAAILSDMNAEITVLEEKLSKARQIKQGMMQELLTGRIRLV